MKVAMLLVSIILHAACADKNSGLDNPTIKQHPIGTLYKNTGVWEYLPRGYGAVPNPLIIFLHGLGENGSGSAKDLEKLTAIGIPMLIQQGNWPSDRPFVVLAFQQQNGCPTDDQIKSHIDFAIGNYAIDSNRIYLTGLSCGAYGIGDYLAKYGSQQIAAAVPIAGPITPAWTAQGCALVQNTAIWGFFGDQDSVSGYASNSAAMKKFIECPAPRKDVLYTVYPGVGHDSWTSTYDLSAGHDIYAWMLKQSK